MFHMRFHRVALTVSLVFLVFALLVLSSPSPSQNPPADAAEISRDLLYLAPTRVAPGPSTGMPETVFSSKSYSYRYVEREGWSVTPVAGSPAEAESERRGKRTFTLAGESYTLTPFSDDDRATLALSRQGDPEPLVTAVLWNREQLLAAWLPVLQRQKKALTAAALQQDLEVGDPILYAIELAGDSVWVAVGHSTGEGELGLGTVVRFDVKSKQARVFKPGEIATCAVTHLSVTSPDSLLLGTRRQYEGSISPCAGLVLFHPSSQQLEKIAPVASPLSGAIVTALNSTGRVWVATDKGICGGAPEGPWHCWRIVPTVTLKSATQITNKPGEKSGSELKPGNYEVLWANQAFLEIATKDSYDAWLAADDFAEAAARNFDAEPYKLLNTSGSFSPIRPLVKPGGDALQGTLVYRAPLERLPTPQGTPAGWAKVRVHAGWIERGKLEIVPKLIPIEK